MAGDTDACEDDVGSGREVARIWRSSVCIRSRKSFCSAFHASRIDACICRSEVRVVLLVAKVFSSVTMQTDNVIAVVVSEKGGIGGFCVDGLVGADEFVGEFFIKELVMAVALAGGGGQ